MKLRKCSKKNGILCFLMATAGCLIFCPPEKKKEGFSVEKVSSRIPYTQEWAVENSEELSKVVDEITSQEFTYLGAGAQSYAFLGQDKKTVIKFLKMRHLLPRAWLNYFPKGFLKKKYREKIEKRQKKLQSTFNNYKMIYDELREETGLIYIHLNPSKFLKKKLSLVDKKGKKHCVELDSSVFILQKKADLIYAHLAHLMEKGEISAAEEALRSFRQLVHSRVNKGFIDLDKGISRNYGFFGSQAIHIDFGQLTKEIKLDDNQRQQEILKINKKLNEWLNSHHPQLLSQES